MTKNLLFAAAATAMLLSCATTPEQVKNEPSRSRLPAHHHRPLHQRMVDHRPSLRQSGETLDGTRLPPDGNPPRRRRGSIASWARRSAPCRPSRPSPMRSLGRAPTPSTLRAAVAGRRFRRQGLETRRGGVRHPRGDQHPHAVAHEGHLGAPHRGDRSRRGSATAPFS